MYAIGATHQAGGWPIEHPDRPTLIAVVVERTDAELVVTALNGMAASGPSLDESQRMVEEIKRLQELATERAAAIDEGEHQLTTAMRIQELEQQVEQLTAPKTDPPAQQ